MSIKKVINVKSIKTTDPQQKMSWRSVTGKNMKRYIHLMKLLGFV